jgi:predicted MFS family arabinose efflux permease
MARLAPITHLPVILALLPMRALRLSRLDCSLSSPRTALCSSLSLNDSMNYLGAALGAAAGGLAISLWRPASLPVAGAVLYLAALAALVLGSRRVQQRPDGAPA